MPGALLDLHDGLGSVRQLSDAQGNIVQRYEHSPFGEVLAAQGQRPSALQYTGEQNDLATGLIYLRARWYDPATGRFTTRDPFPGLAALPQTLHPYVYALNNPINLKDPSGEIVETPWDVLVFIIDAVIYFVDAINPALDQCTRQQLLLIDLAALGIDGAALLFPGAPGGAGLAGRVFGQGTRVLVQGGVRVAQIGVRGAQVGTHAAAMTKGGSRGTRGSVGGGSSGSTYRDRFYKQYPNAPRDYKIHHRIPQKARDMGIFPAKVVDSVDNLRAVPENIHNQISTEWTHFWRRYGNTSTTILSTSLIPVASLPSCLCWWWRF
jgi:RHS repeat-associated protein